MEKNSNISFIISDDVDDGIKFEAESLLSVAVGEWTLELVCEQIA